MGLKNYNNYDTDVLDYLDYLDELSAMVGNFSDPEEERDYPAFTMPGIDRVVFNPPATVILWSDKTKTVVKCCEKDEYNREVGFKTALLTKIFTKQTLKELVRDYVTEDAQEEEEKAGEQRKRV